MNDEFNCKIEEAQPNQILQKLKEYFSSPDDVEWYRVSCAIYNAKMSNGVLVTDHALYMIEMIERLGKIRCLLHK